MQETQTMAASPGPVNCAIVTRGKETPSNERRFRESLRERNADKGKGERKTLGVK